MHRKLLALLKSEADSDNIVRGNRLDLAQKLDCSEEDIVKAINTLDVLGAFASHPYSEGTGEFSIALAR